MTTELLDSTVSQLLQDNSSVEYVSQEENPIASKDLPPETVIKRSLITEKQYRMCVANLFGFEARVIVTNPKDIKDPRSTWWCLADTGNAIGASRSGSLLGLLHRRERDSRIFTNAEIIFDDFKSKYTLPLANRGNTFVSLSGFLEILSKTELSSKKIDDFQEEIFGRVLPQLAFEGKAEVSDEYKEKIGMPQPQAQPTIYDYARALIAEKERSDALEAQNKALQAERDEAIRTKAQIGSNREATAMATASAKSRECKRLETENDLLTSENSRLRQDYVENKDFCKQLLAQKLVVYVEKTLRDRCSKALQELSSLMEIPRLEWNEWNDKAGREVPRYAYHKDVCAELKQRIIDNPKYLVRFK